MSDKTVVLLGDSILDNRPYTRPEPDTTAHLERLLGAGWVVRLAAVDGATMSTVPAQLARLAGRPSHAVLSVGGNDATAHVGLLEHAGARARHAFEELLEVADAFEQQYEATARAVAARAERTILCTIYEPPLEPAAYGRRARVPIAVLNDRIVRTGMRLGVDVIELRSVCTAPADFVRQIEPSAMGAVKIARAIAGVLQGQGGIRAARIFGA